MVQVLAEPKQRYTWEDARIALGTRAMFVIGAHWDDEERKGSLMAPCPVCGIFDALQLIPQDDGSIKAECLSTIGCKKTPLEKKLKEEPWDLILRRGRPKRGNPKSPNLKELPEYVWDANQAGDAWRLIREHGPKLLLAEIQGEYSHVYVLDVATGIWVNSPERLETLHFETAKKYAIEIAMLSQDGVVDAKHSMALQRWCLKTRRAGGAEEMAKCLWAAYQEMVGMGHTVAIGGIVSLSMLDADLRYLGCANGIVDLNTSELMDAEEGAGKLVTYSTGVEYDLWAEDPNIDAMLSHLDESEREYLLNAGGYALRGNPGGRWYLLVGPTRSGKSTYLRAVGAALGQVADGGYAFSLPERALLVERHGSPNAHSDHLKYFPYGRVAISSELPQGRESFNDGLIKRLTGGDDITVRAAKEAAGASRVARATIFFSLNETDVDRLSLVDQAMAARTRILPWPDLPEGTVRDPERINQVTTPEASRAMLNILIRRAAANVEIPQDIPSVQDAIASKRSESLGRLGQWFLTSVQVTGRLTDYVVPDDLWAKACEELGGAAGVIDGMDRGQGIRLLRESVSNMPKQSSRRVNGRITNVYAGVKLLGAEEIESTMDLDEQVCSTCGDPFYPVDGETRCGGCGGTE